MTVYNSSRSLLVSFNNSTQVQQMTGERVERQRLRQWLENQINSGNVPKLCWVNKTQGIFKVPWKHAGKPGFVLERDAVLFREWARHTGKYRDGDHPDPSTWKTRFRCALNKLPDIEEVKERSYLDGDEPYRVFQFLPKARNEGTEALSRSPYDTDIFGHSPAPGLGIKLEHCLDGEMEEDVDTIQDFLMDNLAPMKRDDDLSGLALELSSNKVLLQFNSKDISQDDCQECFPPLPVNPIMDVNINEIVGMDPEAMELDVKIFYKGKQVAQRIVNNQLGCRIHSGADFTWLVGSSELHGPREADQIQFPDEGSPPAIMENLNRGLLLQWENNSIVVTRFCQAHVYASGGSLESSVRRLERKERTRVFDYDRFLAGLADYRVNRAPVPSYEVFFAFGQQPASGTTVDPGVGVTVSVTHLTAKRSISMVGSAYDVLTSAEDGEDVLVKNFQQLLRFQQAVPLQQPFYPSAPNCT